jgi:hypothetical protein
MFDLKTKVQILSKHSVHYFFELVSETLIRFAFGKRGFMRNSIRFQTLKENDPKKCYHCSDRLSLHLVIILIPKLDQSNLLINLLILLSSEASGFEI